MTAGASVSNSIIVIITSGINSHVIIIPAKEEEPERIKKTSKITVSSTVRFFEERGCRRENRIPHNVNSGITLVTKMTINHAHTTSCGCCKCAPTLGKLHPPQAIINPVNIISFRFPIISFQH